MSGCPAEICGIHPHLSGVFQNGFGMSTFSGVESIEECGMFRSIHSVCTRESDSVVIGDYRATYRQLPAFGFDEDPSNINVTLGPPALSNQLIDVGDGFIEFRYFDQSGSYNIRAELSDPVTREELAAHLFVLYANFDYDAPVIESTFGITLTTFSQIDRSIVSGAVFYSRQEAQLVRFDYLLNGQQQTDFVPYDWISYCDGGTRAETPVAGQIFTRELGLSAFSPHGQAGLGAGGHAGEEDYRQITLGRMIGRRWDSRYTTLPPERCLFTAIVGSSRISDGCRPIRIDTRAEYTCSFNDPIPPQRIHGGARRGFFAPLDDSVTEGFDHVIFMRCLPGNAIPLNAEAITLLPSMNLPNQTVLCPP